MDHQRCGILMEGFFSFEGESKVNCYKTKEGLGIHGIVIAGVFNNSGDVMFLRDGPQGVAGSAPLLLSEAELSIWIDPNFPLTVDVLNAFKSSQSEKLALLEISEVSALVKNRKERSQKNMMGLSEFEQYMGKEGKGINSFFVRASSLRPSKEVLNERVDSVINSMKAVISEIPKAKMVSK